MSASISTMTILLVLDKSVNLTKVLDEFKTDNIQDFICEVTGDKNSITTSSKRPFNNAVVFNCRKIYTDDGTLLEKQAVKVFCNGNIHITGVKNVLDALYLGDVFVTMLEIMYGGDGMSSMFTFTRFDVQLVNLYFQVPLPSVKQVLDLRKVKDVLQKTTPYYVCYNTERHAGVIVKATDFTLLIFDSGNVIISSIKEPYQLQIVKGFVQEHIIGLPSKDTVLNKPDKYSKRAKQDPFDYGSYLVLK